VSDDAGRTGFVDLHTHSTASDGTLSPEGVIDAAQRCGLTAIALTDHDTMDGVAAARTAGERLGIRVIAGVELSAFHDDHEVHLLALHLTHLETLQRRLGELRASRHVRAEKIVEAGSTVFLENSEHVHFYTILSGWAFRYKILEDGRRQILNFTLPSDLLGLQNAIFKTMKHSVEALTDLTLCVFDRNQLWELYTNHPDLAFDTTWIAAREENLVGDNLVSVGRRTGIERVAYVLLHLFSRAEQLQLTKRDELRLPVTQQQIADALGLSLVHTNTTIQRLTKLGLITWKQGIFLLRDRDGLAAIVMYRYEDASPRPFI